MRRTSLYLLSGLVGLVVLLLADPFFFGQSAKAMVPTGQEDPNRLFKLAPERGTTTAPLGCATWHQILIVYADDRNPTMLRDMIVAEPGVVTVDTFDASLSTPTLELLLQYQEVVVFSEHSWFDATAMGNVLADYQDADGVTVVMGKAFFSGGPALLGGRWMTSGYSPFVPQTGFDPIEEDLDSYIIGHPLMEGITHLNSYSPVVVTMAVGATQVATYTGEYHYPLVGVKTNNGHTGVAINANLSNSYPYFGDWGHLIVNAARWLVPAGCSTPTVTPTNTNTVVPTFTGTAVSTSTTTMTPVATITPTSTGTAVCTPVVLTDVQATDYFYAAVQYLNCHGAISGYSDGSFRPYNNTTRGQLTKIVVVAEGLPINSAGGPHFTDVPTDSPFYAFIETAYNRGFISGYSDGTFRWGNNITRAQLSKVVVLAAGWAVDTTRGPHFSDVPDTSPFYAFVETAYNHGIIGGYSDGTFRPNNNATRGQIAVIVYRALTQP